MSDPYVVPAKRRATVAPLVDAVRVETSAWRAGGYAGASGTSKRLLEHWFLDEHESSPGTRFQWYFAQREAVETLIYLHEVAQVRTLASMAVRYAREPLAVGPQDFPRYVFKMATGSGKTKVMSLALTWAYFHALREPESAMSTTSLVIAPNLIVYERLRDDFEHARVFLEDPLLPPEWRRDFDLRVVTRGEDVPLEAPGVLLLTNVQQLYDRPAAEVSNPVMAMLGRKPVTGVRADPPLRQIARRGRVLVINDEAHHLHDEVKGETGEPLKAILAIQKLHELASDGVAAQLDFSATPRNNQGKIFPETVVDYPLAAAIEDGIVKRPVIGEIRGVAAEATSDDAAVRYRQRILTGVEKWREYRDALAPAGKKPLLFVMAEDTKAADQIADYLERLSDLGGKVLTIHVNMTGSQRGEVRTADLDELRKAAREVDRDDSPYSAIVSVLMLREGWDVRNVSVIVPLRALSSTNAILPEQTLGRGLRRMTPPGSGVEETVVVIEHEAFRELWDRALDADELDIERVDVDKVKPPAKVIAVELDRIDFDIAIPMLPRVLSRQAVGLKTLRLSELPERNVPLAATLEDGTVEYVGRDILTGIEVERTTYALSRPFDGGAVLAWFVNEVQRESRLTGQFAVLAPIVKGYIETRLFGRTVQLEDPLVLQALEQPAVQGTVLAVLGNAVDEATLQSADPVVSEAKELLLSSTRPFLWSRETAAVVKSVFGLQPCDSGLEVTFAGFLDRCGDVAAFAKLAREVRFSLEYRAEGGRLAYYYPDFVARLGDGRHLLIETKGLVDLDVPHKDVRAARWAADASILSGTPWTYLRVDEEPFMRSLPGLRSMEGLLDLVNMRQREALLKTLPSGRTRSRADGFASIDRLREKMRAATGVDEELSRFREGFDV